MTKIWFALALLLSMVLPCAAVLTPVPVPTRMVFAGMQLELTEGARRKVQETVNKLMQSERYHQLLLDRAATYMPHIEDAFAWVGVPEDLKYIALQESALIGDAVSSSNAVGFWQMKDYTARQFGIIVSDQVDERKHITRASMAAARYFKYNYGQLDNWFYAVVAYMTGTTGALPYVKEQYRGAKSMVLTEEDHWYGLKALAHKIAFEAALKEVQPKVWLEAKSAGTELSLWKILQQEGLAKTAWQPYNLWASQMKLPAGRPGTYFVPRTGSSYHHVQDPHLGMFGPCFSVQKAPEEKLPEPPPIDTSWQAPQIVLQDTTPATPPGLWAEPYHEVAFAFVLENQTLALFADQRKLSDAELRRYNGWQKGKWLERGTRVLLEAPKDIPVHIVLPGETLESIAAIYGRDVQLLLSGNRLEGTEPKLLPGQKLYLDRPRPVGEPVVIYKLPF